MSVKVRDLLIKVGVAILFWALSKNRKIMVAVVKKTVASLTIQELVSLSFNIKDAVKNVK